MSNVENYLLGMDCGTTNIKAIILGEDGTVAASASRPSKFILPGLNMQEQDANEWWSNAKEIFQSLVSQVDERVVKRIRGISISSHTVSMLPLDENGCPVRNALTYQDGRSSEELHYIVDTIGFDNFVQIVGGQPSVAFLPNKILWFKKNEPELFAKTKHFLQASSYINYKLTGKMTSDIDQATRTQCLDIGSMSWSKEIGEVIGVDLNAMLPDLKLVDEIIGFVTEQAAEETGLREGIPVIAGCSDAMASMYAIGMSKLGEVGESSGTTSLVFVGGDKKSRSDIPVVTRPCTIDGMPWIFDAPIQTSGAALKWFIETFAAEERAEAEKSGKNIYAYLNELALEAPAGSKGLLFFPYLLGERAPLWNDYARGMFIGMGMDTSRADITRAVFEGTAFALRHVIETVKEAGAKADCLRICGGGAKSRTWSQIKASMLHMPVYVLDDTSGDVPVGDVLLVGRKVGVFPNLTEAAERIVKVKEIIEPVKEWEEVYDKLYPYYVEMYQHLDQDLESLKKTVSQL
ncbi:MAG: FGGY-family carbohydrate kinase [Hespellia sp.]|nr:FGGY-family carbohydrate kinase [Hespellia sp.]